MVLEGSSIELIPTPTALNPSVLRWAQENFRRIVDAFGTSLTDLENYLPLTGGTLTGDLVLAADANAALEAVTKQQLDTAINPRKIAAGNTGSVSGTVSETDLLSINLNAADALETNGDVLHFRVGMACRNTGPLNYSVVWRLEMDGNLLLLGDTLLVGTPMRAFVDFNLLLTKTAGGIDIFGTIGEIDNSTFIPSTSGGTDWSDRIGAWNENVTHNTPPGTLTLTVTHSNASALLSSELVAYTITHFDA